LWSLVTTWFRADIRSFYVRSIGSTNLFRRNFALDDNAFLFFFNIFVNLFHLIVFRNYQLLLLFDWLFLLLK
jgi:hypothetical protein